MMDGDGDGMCDTVHDETCFNEIDDDGDGLVDCDDSGCDEDDYCIEDRISMGGRFRKAGETYIFDDCYENEVYISSNLLPKIESLNMERHYRIKGARLGSDKIDGTTRYSVVTEFDKIEGISGCEEYFETEEEWWREKKDAGGFDDTLFTVLLGLVAIVGVLFLGLVVFLLVRKRIKS
jgi:hypothetical protein